MPTPTLYKFISSELHRITPDEIVDDDDNLVFFDDDFQIMPKILDFDNDVQDITDNLFNGLSLDDPIHDEHFKKTFLFRFMNRQINRQTIEAFKFELMNTFLTSQSYINRVYQDSEKYILQYSESEGTSQELSNEISKMVNEQITELLDRRENEERNSSQSKQNTSNYSTQNTSNESKQNTSNNSEENTTQSSNQTVDGRTDTDNRMARSDLPQNTVNLNLDNRTMTTANENEISKSRTDDNRTTDTTTDTETSGSNTSETTGNTTGETTDNSTGETTINSSGESSGESTGETSTDTKGKSDTERDSTRDGKTTGSQISYSLDELFKSTGLMEGIFNTFDRKCFLQTW